MTCETPTCSNAATRRVVLAPTAEHPRGRLARVCSLCRPLIRDVAKERAL